MCLIYRKGLHNNYGFLIVVFQQVIINKFAIVQTIKPEELKLLSLDASKCVLCCNYFIILFVVADRNNIALLSKTFVP